LFVWGVCYILCGVCVVVCAWFVCVRVCVVCLWACAFVGVCVFVRVFVGVICVSVCMICLFTWVCGVCVCVLVWCFCLCGSLFMVCVCAWLCCAWSTAAGRELFGHQLPNGLGRSNQTFFCDNLLCGLLKRAVTLADIVRSIWITVEIIVQVCNGII